MALSLSVVENKPFAVFTNFLAKNLLLSGPSERCCLLVCLLVGRSWVLQSQYLKQDLKQWHSEKDQWRVQGRGPGNPAPPLPIFRPKWGLKGRKKKIGPPSPSPSPYLKFWIRHWGWNGFVSFFTFSMTGKISCPFTSFVSPPLCGWPLLNCSRNGNNR